MATIKKTSGAQWPLVATFEFTVADAMKNSAGVLSDLDDDGTFPVIPLPYGAQVIGGDFTVEVVSNDTGTHTVKIGDSGNDDRYSNNTTIDLKSLGRTALTPTGYVNVTDGIELLLAAGNADATTGSFKLNVLFVVEGRQSENLKTT